MRKMFVAGVAALALLGPSQSLAGQKDPIQIIVSLEEQYLRVFRGAEQIAASNISSGKVGHETPTGIFSVLQKNRHHRSNIYSNAPMPFMQRLTWSGIALHGSNHVPRTPASHGCVRLPGNFAGKLFKMATNGMHVIIEERPELPQKLIHPALFQPKVTWEVSERYDQWVNQHIEAQNEGFIKSDIRYPARIFITRRTHKDDLIDAQKMLNRLGFAAGVADGIMGPATWQAIEAFRKSEGLTTGSGLNNELLEKLYAATGKPRPANGRLLVRKHHRTIYETEVHLDQPENPLGSHLLTVTGFEQKKHATGWMSVTLNDRVQEKIYLNGSRQVHKFSGRFDIRETLSRIQMSKHDREQIERFLSPRSSITISDNGISIETGAKATDFIVLTDPEKNEPSATSGLKKIAG